MTAKTRGLFAVQVAQAAARRGRLDPVYQQLSDEWTIRLQKLYPVWCLIGPALADPAHIEIHSRTVSLDSDRLLGTRRQIVDGTLDPWRILVSFGASLHEVFHAVHTKPWFVEHNLELADSSDPADRQRAIDRVLLEEPRMEAHGTRDYPASSARGRFARRAIRAAVADVIAPDFATAIGQSTALGGTVSRDLAGTSMTYLHARTHCDTVDAAVLQLLQPIWEQVLGAADVARLDDLYARLVWVLDGDNAALDRFADEYREIIGPPDGDGGSESASGQQAGGSGGGRPGGDDTDSDEAGGGSDDGAGEGDAGQDGRGTGAKGQAQAPVSVRSLTDALRDAADRARAGELEQLNEDVSLKDLLAGRGGEATAPQAGGGGTGAPTGRMPNRSVDRPPLPDEARMATQYANRLASARSAAFRRIDKRTPGGRFNARAHVRGQAQRRMGVPVTSHPWSIQREVRAPLEEPHVGLIIDTSGSMHAFEYALGPIAWILSTGLQRFGGRVAISLFGNGCELLTDGSKALSRVPGIRTGGGTAFGGDAIEVATDQLDITNPRRPRLTYVLSDGGWWDTEAGVQRIRRLRELGVPTIHISIGIAPLSVEADRIVVIDDPATAMDIIADDTVEALRRPAQRPIVAQPAALVERVR